MIEWWCYSALKLFWCVYLKSIACYPIQIYLIWFMIIDNICLQVAKCIQQRWKKIKFELWWIFDLTDIRADGRSYPAEDILHAISKVTKFMVNIVCKKDRMGNVYLLQIHLCIDNNATGFIDCQDQAMNCDEDTIIFPDQKYIPRNKGMDIPKCIKP